jgi:hypothetical protein
MDRITLLLLTLILSNLGFWLLTKTDVPAENGVTLQEAVFALEKELPGQEAFAQWAQHSRAGLNASPPEDAGRFLTRIQALAVAWKFSIQETAQIGNNPVRIILSGVSSYKSAAQLLGEIGRNPAVLVDSLSLIGQDDFRVATRLEMTVRTGPFRGTSPAKDRLDLIPGGNTVLSLGRTDLFGREAPVAKPAPGMPRIRYLGFYSGKDRTIGIIEENLKVILAQPGDRTPSGLNINRITPEYVEIQPTRERENAWKIPLEKSR